MEGGVRGLSSWTKIFNGYQFFVHVFNCYMMSFWNRNLPTHGKKVCQNLLKNAIASDKGGSVKNPCLSTRGRGIKNVQKSVHMVYEL